MHPFLFALLVITGAAFAYLTAAFTYYAERWHDALPLTVPLAVITVCVLAAAGFFFVGVI